MSISRIGTASGTTSCTVPAHAVGDAIIIFAFNRGSTTVPSLPAGYTSINSGAGSTCAARLGYKIATATNDSSGTWTNATNVVCVVYRSSSGFILQVTGGEDDIEAATTNGTTNTITFPNIPSQYDLGGNSWVAGFIGHKSTNQSLSTNAPTGMVNTVDVTSTCEVAGFDTNGGVTAAWPSTNVTVSGTAAGWISYTVEILDGTQTNGCWDPQNLGRGKPGGGSQLSNGYKTSTWIGGGNNQHDQTSVDFVAIGDKRYCEFQVLSPTGIGIAVQGDNLAVSADWDWGANGGSGQVKNGDGSTYNSGSIPSVNDWVAIAIDNNVGKYWVKNLTTGSNWNFNAGDNPATGTGGATFATGHPIYVSVSVGGSFGGSLLINTGTTSFQGTPPSGFSALFAPSGKTLAAGSGSYSLSGSVANLVRNRLISAGAGSYSISGTAAGLLKGKRMFASPPPFPYSITGSSESLKLGRKLTAGNGSYSISGTDAALTRSANVTLAAGSGSYAITGQQETLRLSRILSASAALYSLTGSNANLTKAVPSAHKGKRKVKSFTRSRRFRPHKLV